MIKVNGETEIKVIGKCKSTGCSLWSKGGRCVSIETPHHTTRGLLFHLFFVHFGFKVAKKHFTLPYIHLKGYKPEVKFYNRTIDILTHRCIDG